MIWKIYFFIYLGLTIIGLPVFIQNVPIKPGDLFSLIFSGLLIFATYAYIFNKNVITKKAWTYVFWVVIFLTAESLVEGLLLPQDFIAKYLWIFKTSLDVKPGEILFSLILSIPAIVANYRLTKN